MIFGVTGLYAAGKDTVAEFLKEKGFFHISLSDMIREEAKKRKIPITRENLFTLGNELRAEFGSSVLAEKAFEKVQDGENYAITSIRNIDEAKTILARENAILINIAAPQTERLRRLVERNREQDPTTLKALKDAEEKEMSDDPAAMQIHKVAKMAKVIINNDGTLEELRKKVDRLVEDYLYKLQQTRPSWDEYFMQIAETIKLRSTCLSAGKGTILVRDKRIISTGYNGSPKGVKHCNEGGCKRCKNRHLGKIKSGVYSEPCICCHSEENAIVQAAVHGISTDGAILYTTFTPCVTCAKMIINAQIKEIVAKVLYPDDDAIALLKEARIKIRLFKSNHKFS